MKSRRDFIKEETHGMDVATAHQRVLSPKGSQEIPRHVFEQIPQLSTLLPPFHVVLDIQ
jgi:hypothetical protein